MGFVRPHVSILVGMVLQGLAFIFQLIGVVAPGWFTLRVGQKGEAMIGLWEFCYDQPIRTCDDLSQEWSGEATTWLEVCRAFGVLAVLVEVCCIASGFLQCFLPRFRLLFAVTAWTSIVATLLIFIELAIFSGEVERRINKMGKDFYLQYAFALTIVALVISLFSSLCLFVGESFSVSKPAKPVYRIG